MNNDSGKISSTIITATALLLVARIDKREFVVMMMSLVTFRSLPTLQETSFTNSTIIIYLPRWHVNLPCRQH